MKTKHIGGNFDDFLKEQDILAGAEAVAAKRVLAFQIEKEMKRKGLTKVEMAFRMKTSRTAVDRLLDPANISVTLNTLEKAALVLGKKLSIRLA
jgi:folylpolyglutamate synthase/dihydropteroate synthase